MWSTAAVLPPLAIAGIRTLRLLSESSTIETHLIRCGDDEHEIPARLVRPRNADGAARVLRIISAASRVENGGVIRILDVVEDLHGIAAVVEHPSGRRLSDVLAVRESWAAGEAVALLLPLAATVGAVQGAGAAHGSLRPASIVLAERGPVIDDLSTSVLFEAHAPEVDLEAIPEVRADREALRALAQEVLTRVVGARASAAQALAADVATVSAHEVCAELGRGLAELAAPVSVRAEDPTPVPAGRVADEPASSSDAGGSPPVTAVIERFLGADLAARLRDAVEAVSALGDRLGHRRRRAP